MSILSKFISKPQPYIERELEERYIQMISLFPGTMTFRQIREKVREGIKRCKEEAIIEGTAYLPDDYGECLLRTSQAGNQESKKIIDKAREEGATDEDLREFWNLSDLERRMIKFYENVFLQAMRRILSNSNLSEYGEREIEIEIRKHYPFYGDPDDTSVAGGRDRPLPYELRNRVERWKNKLTYEQGEEKLKERAGRHSTFNALVRAEILAGNL